VLCRALIKHGPNKFTYSILEYCREEILFEIEPIFLDRLRPEYNILTKAGGNSGFRHTAETKEKLSKLRREKNGIAKPIKVTDIVTNSVRTFNSISQAVEEFKIGKDTIKKCINNKIVYKNCKFCFFTPFPCFISKGNKLNNSLQFQITWINVLYTASTANTGKETYFAVFVSLQ
jgi:hypothetical protein